MSDQWDDIGPSDGPGKITLRRADPRHPLDLFRGRDHEGNYLFCFSGKGEFVPHEALNRLNFANLKITLESKEEGIWDFTLRLLDKAEVDIFRALCADLMKATEKLRRGDDREGVGIIVGRLHRWWQVLKMRREKRLTQKEIAGLFGELLLLRDTFLKNLSPLEAIGAWRGPLGEEQDFLYGDWLVEVKTQLSSADSHLRISSENQLDSKSGRILICHQKLGIERGESETARNLNSLVAEVDELLAGADPVARDRFQATLIQCGYEVLSEYGEDFWVLNKRSYFNVGEGFPCITSATLPAGVFGVEYSIRLSSCEAYRLPEDEAIEGMFPRHG